MPFNDLREFIRLLEKRGELRRIKVPVDRNLEITAIADKVMKSPGGGPALLFENVIGSTTPLLINAFGSEKRMAWALGVNNLNEFGNELQKLLGLAQGGPPASLMGKLQVLGDLKDLAGISPKLVKSGPVQEVIERHNPSLDFLPVLKCWPLDAGPFITLPLCFTRDPETGKRNVGMYRMQIYDSRTTGMHWQLHKGGAEHAREAAHQRNKRMEVAVALGGDPVLTYAATAPLPPGIDELVFAGFIRKSRVEVVQCQTVDIQVPATAEVVLEGYVDTAETRTEGPFGDHTGYYSLADEYPVFHLTCVTRRRDPIYPTTIVGQPPMEDGYLGKATERFFLHLLKVTLPEVVDMNMPLEGVFHNLVIVSIKKQFPGHAKKVMYGIWGLMLLMLTKMIIVVDADVDVHNLSEVLWRVTNNIDAKRDVVIVDGPVDALDHSSPQPFFGGKMGIDATRKLPQEGHPRVWPDDIEMSQQILDQVERRWKEYGIDKNWLGR